MSVIFGIILGNDVVLAADRRMINAKTGSVESEDFQKIVAANKNVAIAIAGNAGIAKALQADIKHGKKTLLPDALNSLVVDDFCEIIDLCIADLQKNATNYSNDLFSAIMVAGKDQKGNATIRYKSNQDTKWFMAHKQVGQICPVVFPPSDISREECLNILKNAIEYQKTIDGGIVKALKSAVFKVAAQSSSVNKKVTIWYTDLDRVFDLE